MFVSPKRSQRGSVTGTTLAVYALIFLVATEIRHVSPATAIWTAPCLLFAALVIAWGAESAQFFISQGFALAILAWMQTLPEFAVEAVIAWHQQVPYLFANLSGALRMLTGLGWPMIYFAAATVHRRRAGVPLRRIELEPKQSVNVIGLLVPLIYVSFVLAKGSLDVYDAAVLVAIYAAYLYILGKMPPEEEEGIEDLERIPRAIVRSPRPRRIVLITLCFVVGGALIYFTAEPFLGSLIALAAVFGIPNFVMIQWVAPFVSEFPEMASTFYWARTVIRAPMAMMNMVSSNINQWTLLTAMLPVLYSLSRGSISALVFDQQQKLEVLMTLAQAFVGMLFLMNMVLAWWEAAMLFVLWFVQFIFSAISPDVTTSIVNWHSVHWYITLIYIVWAAVELVRMVVGHRKPEAFLQFARVWREHILQVSEKHI